MLRAILRGEPPAEVAQATAARVLGGRLNTAAPDPVVACYVDSNFASMLHLLAKYPDFKSGVLANANAGGENVHRGLVLGRSLVAFEDAFENDALLCDFVLREESDALPAAG